MTMKRIFAITLLLASVEAQAMDFFAPVYAHRDFTLAQWQPTTTGASAHPRP